MEFPFFFFLLTTKHVSNVFQKQISKLNKTQSSKDLFQLYILHKTIFFNKKFVIKIAVCDSSQWQFWVFSLWTVQFNSNLSWSGVWCGLSFGLTKMLESVNHSCLLLSKDGRVFVVFLLVTTICFIVPSFFFQDKWVMIYLVVFWMTTVFLSALLKSQIVNSDRAWLLLPVFSGAVFCYLLLFDRGI